MELNNFSKSFSTPTLGVGGDMLIFIGTKRTKTKNSVIYSWLEPVGKLGTLALYLQSIKACWGGE